MTHAVALSHEAHTDSTEKTIFGFWAYLMTDCVLFATFFATYAVLHNNTYGGPSSRDLFDLPYALAQTLILLVSSFTSGLSFLAAKGGSKRGMLVWSVVTFLLGAAFLALELHEFRDFVLEGNSWKRSGFLTSFFCLVGLHGTHITFGLLWAAVMMGQVLTCGITTNTLRRISCFTMYWHFLDVVWIFIFTIVYMMGVM